jgi:hypothetical protein
MPKAYNSALEEVIRRRKYGKKVAAFLQKVNELLAKLREEEKTQRVKYVQFITIFISYIKFPQYLWIFYTQRLDSWTRR